MVIFLKLLPSAERTVQLEQTKVAISNIFTASKVEIENGDLKTVEATTQFASTDRQIHLCYDLSSSRPISMTYLWYHKSTLVFRRDAEVESGLNCTLVQFNPGDSIPLGHYAVYFGLDGVQTDAKIEFDVVDSSKKS